MTYAAFVRRRRDAALAAALPAVLTTALLLLVAVLLYESPASDARRGVSGAGSTPATAAAISPEMARLRPFHRDYAWEGTIAAGVLSRESPAVRVAGSARFRWIMDSAAVVGEYRQDHHASGASIPAWRAHYVAGWDAAARQYRALMVTRDGWSAAAAVTVAGDRYVMQSAPYPSGGTMEVTRMTLRATGADAFAWTKEVSRDGGPWRVTESFTARVIE